MKKLEIILIIGAVIGFLMVLFNIPLSPVVVSLFFGYWVCYIFTLALHCSMVSDTEDI